MAGSESMRIAILGKTGSGKSSLANTIFGEKPFKVGHTCNSETNECQAETRSVDGRSITLIDTPGFFDNRTSEDVLKGEIVRCITECAPGPHAFLIVLKYERYTEQEQAIINKIRESFSEEAFKYATVLFTHGDQLPEGSTIEDLVSKTEVLSDLVKKCGDRCHVIDNIQWNEKPDSEYRSNQFQVKDLLKSIGRMVKINNGCCYTNGMLQEVEREIQKEMEVIRKSSPDMSKEEIRKQAQEIIRKRSLKKWAGVGITVLLRIFLGAATLTSWILARFAAMISGAIAYFKPENEGTPQEAEKSSAEVKKTS